MTFDWRNSLLAVRDGGITDFVVLIGFVAISAVAAVIRKAREKKQGDKSRSEQPHQQPYQQPRQQTHRQPHQQDRSVRQADRPEAPQPPPPGPQPTPAEQVLTILRQALTGREAPAPPPPPPEPEPMPPVSQPVSQPLSQPLSQPPSPPVLARERRADMQRRSNGAMGRGVRDEVLRAEGHISAEQAQRNRRIGTMPHLQPSTEAAAGAGPRAGREAGTEARIRVDLSDRENAARAIVYMEILGPPKALRPGPEPWDG